MDFCEEYDAEREPSEGLWGKLGAFDVEELVVCMEDDAGFTLVTAEGLVGTGGGGALLVARAADPDDLRASLIRTESISLPRTGGGVFVLKAGLVTSLPVVASSLESELTASGSFTSDVG